MNKMRGVLAVLLTLAAEIVVPVPVRVETNIAPELLEQALSEVDTIFHDGGIRLDWSFDGASARVGARAAEAAAVTVNVASRPSQFVVHGCSRDLHDHRLGHTLLQSKHITLWTEQITRAVDGNWDREDVPAVDPTSFAKALGRVLAHELGHLFLRLYGHRPSGLMRKAFSHRSLTSRSNRAFRFSNDDLERLRSSLARYQRPLGGVPTPEDERSQR